MEQAKNELRSLLEQMDVPAMRMQLRSEDVAWLRRNLAINNADNPRFANAVALLRSL